MRQGLVLLSISFRFWNFYRYIFFCFKFLCFDCKISEIFGARNENNEKKQRFLRFVELAPTAKSFFFLLKKEHINRCQGFLYVPNNGARVEK